MWSIRVGVFLFLVFCASSLEGASKVARPKKDNVIIRNSTNADDYRLPRHLIPYHYNLEVMPVLEDPDEDLELFSCPSRIWIYAICNEPSKNIITIHSNNITINEDSIKITRINGTGPDEIQIESFEYLEDVHFFTIHTQSDLEQFTQYEIYIEFKTFMPEDRLNGLYLDSYFDKNGHRRYAATTLFAPIHARRAFPHFDEPGMKANYNITIGRRQNYKSLSNSHKLDTIPIEGRYGWVWDIYDTTVPQSSYIIAFIVCDFYYSEVRMGNKAIRVYAVPELIENQYGEYGANLTGGVLSYFEDYFQSEYPLSKMYSIALPRFHFNAMENWGLITYKEKILLYRPDETPESDRYRINYVVSHELAHQYHGNKVSPEFWTWVWLKEGFATFYGHFGLNWSSPEFQPWLQFTPNVLQVAMAFDSSWETHPLSNEPPNSSKLLDIYTRIPYEKGASILRMISSFLTEEIFQKAIQNYIHEYEYKAVTQDQLFDSIQQTIESEEIPGILIPTTIKDILDTWTLQSGVPLVRVRITPNDELLFTQELFIEDPSIETNGRQLWWIPVTISPKPGGNQLTKSGKVDDLPDLWIPNYPNIPATILETNTSGLILVNPSTVGYFRVFYEARLIDRIIDQLNYDHSVLPQPFKSQLLDDYFKMAFAKYIPVEIMLDLTKFTDKETGYIVWKTFLNNMKPVYNLFYGTEDFPSFQEYMLAKIVGSLNAIGGYNAIEGEIKTQTLLRSLLVEWACKLGLKSCLDFASDSMRKYMDHSQKDPLDPNLRGPAYCASVQASLENEEIYRFLLDRYKSHYTSKFQKELYIKALACTRCSHLLRRLLDMALMRNPEIKFEDRPLLIEYVASNPHSKPFIVDFLDDHLEKLLKDKTMKEADVGKSIAQVTEFMRTESDLKRIRDFYNKHTELRMTLSQKMQKNINNAVRKIEKNMAWDRDHRARVRAWLETQDVLHFETLMGECGGDSQGNGVGRIQSMSILISAFILIFMRIPHLI